MYRKVILYIKLPFNLNNYIKCYFPSGIYLAGPAKPYRLQSDEKSVIQMVGVAANSNVGWTYKHIMIKGYKFDVPPKSLLKCQSTNAVLTTSEGGIYLLHRILLIDQRTFMLCRKLITTSAIDDPNNYSVRKVLSIGQRITAVSVFNVLGYKYHILIDKKGNITHVVQLPNTTEVE